MCARAVGDSPRLRPRGASESSRCSLVRQGGGQSATSQIVWIRVGFPGCEPFTLEWHYMLKRSWRAARAG
jgi:hypothetical protein